MERHLYLRLACGWGLVAATIGLATLVGWALEVRWLTSLSPAYIPMAPNTAISFAVLGILLAALARWGASGGWGIAARIGAMLVGTLTLIRLLGFGWA